MHARHWFSQVIYLRRWRFFSTFTLRTDELKFNLLNYCIIALIFLPNQSAGFAPRSLWLSHFFIHFNFISLNNTITIALFAFQIPFIYILQFELPLLVHCCHYSSTLASVRLFRNLSGETGMINNLHFSQCQSSGSGCPPCKGLMSKEGFLLQKARVPKTTSRPDMAPLVKWRLKQTFWQSSTNRAISFCHYSPYRLRSCSFSALLPDAINSTITFRSAFTESEATGNERRPP